jgi:hypothetical protein
MVLRLGSVLPTYEPMNGGSLSMGNNTKCKVVGIGTIRFRCLIALSVLS